MEKGPISLIDIGSLSEPVTKLIETVSNAIGVLYEPTRIRRLAKAEVDAAFIRAEGNIELQSLALRASQRINEVELRRQKNIEAIVQIAAEQLLIETIKEAVSKEPVDEDWIAQFFEYCKDVGNEQMQSVWARLLAGEVTRPGTFSPRTLQTVKMLRPEDAQLFEHFIRYVIYERILYYRISTEESLLDEEKLIHLSDIGLFSGKFFASISHEKIPIYYFNKQFTVANKEGARYPLLVAYYQLTAVGEELFTLCNPEPDDKFLQALFASFRSVGAEASEITERRQK